MTPTASTTPQSLDDKRQGSGLRGPSDIELADGGDHHKRTIDSWASLRAASGLDGGRFAIQRKAARSRLRSVQGRLMSVDRDRASWSRMSLSRASTAGVTMARPSLPPTNTCGGFAIRVSSTSASPSLSGLPVCLPS